jgi:hypothetical protein
LADVVSCNEFVRFSSRVTFLSYWLLLSAAEHEFVDNLSDELRIALRDKILRIFSSGWPANDMNKI